MADAQALVTREAEAPPPAAPGTLADRVHALFSYAGTTNLLKIEAV